MPWPARWPKRTSPGLGRAHNIGDFAVGISGASLKRSHCNEMAKRSANRAESSLADEILQYLISHQRAHDTVEGIVAWWLPVRRMSYAISEVEAALRELVVSGFVIARKTPDGVLHYCMNPREEQAIRRRLEIKTAGSRKRATLPSKT